MRIWKFLRGVRIRWRLDGPHVAQVQCALGQNLKLPHANHYECQEFELLFCGRQPSPMKAKLSSHCGTFVDHITFFIPMKFRIKGK